MNSIKNFTAKKYLNKFSFQTSKFEHMKDKGQKVVYCVV